MMSIHKLSVYDALALEKAKEQSRDSIQGLSLTKRAKKCASPARLVAILAEYVILRGLKVAQTISDYKERVYRYEKPFPIPVQAFHYSTLFFLSFIYHFDHLSINLSPSSNAISESASPLFALFLTSSYDFDLTTFFQFSTT